MFAIMRRIPYGRHYESTNLPDKVGQIQLHRYAAEGFPDGIEDEHQVYLKDNGEIQEALIQEKTIKTIEAPFYNESAFAKRQRPANWPAKWSYPHDPTYAPLADDPPGPNFRPKCKFCDLPIMSVRASRATPDDQRCTCSFEKDVVKTRPLIEVRQYFAIPK
jgi:hypothetical protein